MEIKYNLTGTERKALVKAVSNINGEKSKYWSTVVCLSNWRRLYSYE